MRERKDKKPNISHLSGLTREWKECHFGSTNVTTGCGISLRMVGVASKPEQPRPLPFAGFFIYVKRKFVANLKVIGSLMWKQ